MPMTIHIPRSERFGGIVSIGVNGRISKIPVGVDFVASDAEVAALIAAGIALNCPTIADGYILFPAWRYGTRVVVSINGKATYFPTGVAISVSVQEKEVIDRKGLIYLSSGGAAPAPSFSVNPSISPASGSVGDTFTLSDGIFSNGTVTGRQLFLNGTPISGGNGGTYLATTAGTLTFRVEITGLGGTIQITSAGVTVSVGGDIPDTITAPVLTRTSGPSAPADWTTSFPPDAQHAGYRIHLQMSATTDFNGALEYDGQYVIQIEDYEDGVFDFASFYPAFDQNVSRGAHYVRARFESGDDLVSAWSNTLDMTRQQIPATLAYTSPTSDNAFGASETIPINCVAGRSYVVAYRTYDGSFPTTLTIDGSSTGVTSQIATGIGFHHYKATTSGTKSFVGYGIQAVWEVVGTKGFLAGSFRYLAGGNQGPGAVALPGNVNGSYVGLSILTTYTTLDPSDAAGSNMEFMARTTNSDINRLFRFQSNITPTVQLAGTQFTHFAGIGLEAE